MAEDVKNQQLMSTAELDELADRNQIESFFKHYKDIFDRWLKIECGNEKNFISAMIMDTLMKTIITRLDQFFVIREK